MYEVWLLLSAITRLACIGFIVIAALTIPEAWNLINETSFSKEGNMVYVPLETCKPLSVTFDNATSALLGNTTFTFSNLQDMDDNCHTLTYFINAAVASMIFAGTAILLLFVFDIMSRYCTGPISRSSVVGMSLFLSFMLIQTAACTYAIYNECQYWTTFYEEQFSTLEQSGVDEVRTYANKFFFFLTSLMALVCAGLLVIDSILGLCAGAAPKRNNNKKDNEEFGSPPMNTTTAADSNDTMDDVAANNSPEQASNTVDPKSWTNY